MSNKYNDKFAYAIDSHNDVYPIVYEYSGSLGCAYIDEVFIKNKMYSVMCEVDDERDNITVKGDKLPYVTLDDCRSYFSESQSVEIRDAIKEAGLSDMDILKIVYLEFTSYSSFVLESKGYVISFDSENCIDDIVFKKVVSEANIQDQYVNIEKIAEEVIAQVV